MLEGPLVGGGSDQSSCPPQGKNFIQTCEVVLPVVEFLVADRSIIYGLDCIRVISEPQVEPVELSSSSAVSVIPATQVCSLSCFPIGLQCEFKQILGWICLQRLVPGR